MHIDPESRIQNQVGEISRCAMTTTCAGPAKLRNSGRETSTRKRKQSWEIQTEKQLRGDLRKLWNSGRETTTNGSKKTKEFRQWNNDEEHQDNFVITIQGKFRIERPAVLIFGPKAVSIKGEKKQGRNTRYSAKETKGKWRYASIYHSMKIVGATSLGALWALKWPFHLCVTNLHCVQGYGI